MAKQLAADAFFGAVACTNQKGLTEEFKDHLLARAGGHMEESIKLNFITKDSGERRVFKTGSQRDVREGKGRYDLLPPECIKRLADLYERGARKYGDHNWKKGQPLSSTLDSLLRHAFLYSAGGREEDHLAAVAWNAFTLMWTEEKLQRGDLDPSLDDMGFSPCPKEVPTYEV
jgi:hypothetical protein